MGMEIHHLDPPSREFLLPLLLGVLSVDSIQLAASPGIAALPKLMTFHAWLTSND